MGPYPFGNLGIQPKMRSGQRFENQNQRLQPFTAPNCKNHFLGKSVHEGKKPIKCPVCEDNFSTIDKMKRHIGSAHFHSW